MLTKTDYVTLGGQVVERRFAGTAGKVRDFQTGSDPGDENDATKASKQLKKIPAKRRPSK